MEIPFRVCERTYYVSFTDTKVTFPKGKDSCSRFISSYCSTVCCRLEICKSFCIFVVGGVEPVFPQPALIVASIRLEAKLVGPVFHHEAVDQRLDLQKTGHVRLADVKLIKAEGGHFKAS